MAGRYRDARREALWREVLVRQQQSGLSVRAFCQRQGLSQASFYAWRRTLKQREAERRTARPAIVPPAFLPVVVQDVPPDAHDGSLVIELRGGRRLRLPLSTPAARLAELVHALEAAERQL